jgi:hypothetical protein
MHICQLESERVALELRCVVFVANEMSGSEDFQRHDAQHPLSASGLNLKRGASFCSGPLPKYDSDDCAKIKKKRPKRIA